MCLYWPTFQGRACEPKPRLVPPPGVNGSGFGPPCDKSPITNRKSNRFSARERERKNSKAAAPTKNLLLLGKIRSNCSKADADSTQREEKLFPGKFDYYQSKKLFDKKRESLL